MKFRFDKHPEEFDLKAWTTRSFIIGETYDVIEEIMSQNGLLQKVKIKDKFGAIVTISKTIPCFSKVEDTSIEILKINFEELRSRI